MAEDEKTRTCPCCESKNLGSPYLQRLYPPALAKLKGGTHLLQAECLECRATVVLEVVTPKEEKG